MSDRFMTILILGLLGGIALICATVLTIKGYEGVAYVGLAGTVVGVLAPSPLSKSATASDTVTIDQPPDNPVPVDPQP